MSESIASQKKTGPEMRREPRYQVHIYCTLVRGKEQSQLITEDVSNRGLFLRTLNPPQLRQLVKIVIQLPPQREEVTFHGMAVHVVRPEDANGRVPGVGVQLKVADDRERARWERFVRDVQIGNIRGEKHFPLIDAPKPSKQKDQPVAQIKLVSKPKQNDEATTSSENQRRQDQRYDAKIRLWVKSLDHLDEIYTENISKGGLLLATEERMPIGSKIHVVVMHPVSREPFDLEGVVRRHVQREKFQGVAVELIGMDDEEKARFMEFASSAIEVDLGPSMDLRPTKSDAYKRR